MKILIVNTLYAPNQIGGAEKSVQMLAENFALIGHTVKVICLDKEDSNYELANVHVQALKIKNNYWPFEKKTKNHLQKFFWHLKDAKNKSYDSVFRKIIGDFNPDILFTNNLSGFSSNIWSIAKSLRVKIVHTLRDYYLQCPKSTKFKKNSNCTKNCLNCKFLTTFKREKSHQIDYLIGISKFILDDHINNGYFKGVHNDVIFNGFNLNLNKSKERRNETIVFGFIGQIKESKGIEFILKCFTKITNTNWKLLVAGEVDEVYLTHLIGLNNSSKIVYLGHVDSKDFYTKIDVLIVPSLWNEPFGRVVLESYIHKTPVLASNVGGIPELMSINKEFLFEVTPSSLIQQIDRIILNPEVLNRFNFDQEFFSKFSIEKTVNRYLDIFNSVLTNKQ